MQTVSPQYLLYKMLQPTRDKYLKSDKDQYCTAEDACLACELRTCFFTDCDTRKADKEGNNADEQTSKERFKPIIVGNGKANRERINGGSDTLHEQCAKACGGLVLARILIFDALIEHLAAYVTEQYERDPRNTFSNAANCFAIVETHIHPIIGMAN